MVRVEVAVPDPGVRVAGENEQCKLLGRLAQESEIGLLEDPDCILADTVTLPDFPLGRVRAVGDALKDTLGPGAGGGTVVAQLGL